MWWQNSEISTRTIGIAEIRTNIWWLYIQRISWLRAATVPWTSSILIGSRRAITEGDLAKLPYSLMWLPSWICFQTYCKSEFWKIGANILTDTRQNSRGSAPLRKTYNSFLPEPHTTDVKSVFKMIASAVRVPERSSMLRVATLIKNISNQTLGETLWVTC